MPQGGNQPGVRGIPLEDCCNLLAAGFLRGGTGFLRGSSGVTTNLPKEIRTGVSLVSSDDIGPSNYQAVARYRLICVFCNIYERHLYDDDKND